MDVVYSKEQKKLFLWIAYIITPISGLSLELYVPALPIIAEQLHTTSHLVQLTLVSFALAYGLGQLCAGFITDRYGRKKVLLTAAIAHVFVCGLLVFSQSIYQLIILRFLQGACVCFIVVPKRAMVADLFPGKLFAQKMSNLALAWSVGIIIAPWIGAKILEAYSWSAIFIALLLYNMLLVILIIFFLKETHFVCMKSLRWGKVKKLCRLTLMNRKFALSFVVDGIGFSVYSLFALIAPFIVYQKLHLSPIVFGRMALFLGLSYAAGNIVNSFFKFNNQLRVCFICVVMMMLGGLSFLVLSYTVGANYYTLLLPNLFMVFFFALMFPFLVSYALSIFSGINGIVNSMFFSGMWLATGVIVFLGSFIDSVSIQQYAQFDLLVLVFLLGTFILLISSSKKSSIF